MRISKLLLAVSACAIVGGCDFTVRDSGGKDAAQTTTQKPPLGASQSVDPFASRDPKPGETLAPELADDEPRPVMQMQVVLDRLGFTPGVIDGKEGLSTRNALVGFQEANALAVTGKADEATKQALAHYANMPATRVVTIPADFAAGDFAKLPQSAAEKARLDALGYESLDEKLAERFHTTIETLKALNPGGKPAGAKASVPDETPLPSPTPEATPAGKPNGKATPAASASYFRPGQEIRVPNIGADAIDPATIEDTSWRSTLASLGVGTSQPKVAKAVVSKSNGTLRAFDASGKLVAMFTATMGSKKDPLPLGEWKIRAVARNPTFTYNPELYWDVADSKEKQHLPPGPNSPVGVVWIALSKPHYGIHGTPAPETIGRAESYGCVRLTNWDAARLAQMVDTATQVLFEA